MNRVPPKPVRRPSLGEHKGPKGRLVVFASIWSEPMLWTYDGDHEKVEFSRCQEARDYAKAHGYDGIRIQSPKRKGK